MKNKIYKVLGIVLTMAIVLSACFCAMTIASADVTEGDITYPTFSQGNIYEKDGAPVIQTTNDERAYTATMYKVADYQKIVVSSPYQANYWFFDAEGNYIRATGYQTTSEVTLANLAGSAAQFRVVLKDTSSSKFNYSAYDATSVEFHAFPADYEVPEDIIDGTTLYPVLGEGYSVDGRAGLTTDTCLVVNAKRRYTVNTYECKDVTSISFDNTHCRIYVQYFDANKAWVAGSGWQTTGSYKIDGSKAYFRVTVSGVEGGNDANLPNEDAITFTIKEKAPEDVIKDGILYPALVSGTINGAPFKVDTCLGAHPTRLATVNTYKIADFDRIVIGDGISIFVQFFMEDGSYTSVGAGSGWIDKAGSYVIKTMGGAAGATYFRVTYDSNPRGSVPTPGLMTFTLKTECAHSYDNACDADCNECGEVREVADHVYDNACDADCNECGDIREVADHVYDNACDADCNECGDIREVADHVYDNACDADCNECGDIREVADHVYDNACDADCNECGDIREVADHVYDNDCDADCNECGDIREVADHVYDNACDADCNECGDIREVADHVYDNACDADCNECGDIREVADHVYDNACDADCNECGDTREVGDHAYADEYDFWCDECGFLREFEVASDELVAVEKDGETYIYIDGLTVVAGLYEIDGEYYVVTWGGKVVGEGTHYVANSYCDLAAGRNFAVDADGKVLNGLVEIDGVKYFYENGRTAVAGLFEDDGKYYVVTWGGKVKADGKYFATTSYCDVAAGRDFVVGADGAVLDGIVEIDGTLYLYDKGITVAPGTFEVDGKTYEATWGGKIVAEIV